MPANPVPSDEDWAAYENRRKHARVEVALPAFIHALGDRHSVQLVDLSPGGAKLRGVRLFPAGTEVTLDCGTIGRAAVIRWQREDMMGLAFTVELEEREVAAQVERSKALAAWMKARK